MIRAFINYDRNNWDKHLVEFEVAYYSSVHFSTSFTPYFLNYGIHPRTIPIELTVPEKTPSVKEFLGIMNESSAQAYKNIRKRNE